MRTVENAGAGKHLQQPLCVCGWASIMVFGQTEGQSSDMNTLDILNFKFDVVLATKASLNWVIVYLYQSFLAFSSTLACCVLFGC